MIITKVHQEVPVSFRTQSGFRVIVDAGDLIGWFNCLSHNDEARPKSSYKLAQCIFATPDVDGWVYSYRSLLTLRTLWPDPTHTVQNDPCFFDFHDVSIRDVEIRGESLPPIRIRRSSGVVERQWTGLIKASFQCRRRKWGLDSRLSVHSGDPLDLNLAYRVSLSQLLWRPDAQFVNDDILAEAADYVCFERIRPISDYDAKYGLRPGPIRVTPSL